MDLRKTLLESRNQVEKILEWKIGMQAADNVKLRNGLGVARSCRLESFFQRHGIGARSVLLAAESTQPAGGHAYVGWVQMAVDIEICLVAMHALANMVGHPAYRQNIAGTVKQTERGLSKKHLIAQNFANYYLKIEKPDSNVSILNFHYAYPPKTVTDNYGLNKPVSFDETFDGVNASGRRREAWPFMLAGGAVYDNLDWSFANDDMTGMGLHVYGKQLKGEAVWKQLEILHQTMQQFDFVQAKPIDSLFRKGLPEGVSVYGLGIKGKDYLLYWLKTKKDSLAEWNCPLPAGRYRVKWMDPANGHITGKQIMECTDNQLTIKIPPFEDDRIMHIQRLQ